MKVTFESKISVIGVSIPDTTDVDWIREAIDRHRFQRRILEVGLILEQILTQHV